MDTAASSALAARSATPRWWATLTRLLTRNLGAFGVTAVLAVGGVGSLVAQCAPPATPQQQVVDITNQRRAEAGLPALVVDGRLANAAQAHSQDQANMNRMTHTGSDGSTLGTRVTRQGYAWGRAAENVAAGYADAAGVMQGWMGSAGHRANILDPNVIHIGVGLAYSANGTPYWTMVLARPL